MEDSSNLCLSCGLCCDGTLIGFVQLEQQEVPALRQIMDIEETNNENIFLHPCDKFCDGCTIYPDRPKNCIKFKCGLLKDVEQNAVTFESAVGSIELAKKKRAVIKDQLSSLDLQLKSESFYFKMIELKRVLASPKFESMLTAEHNNILTNIKDLEELLTEKFNLSFT